MPFKPDFVCSNPSCRSYGTSHYNCQCAGPGEEFSNGGAVHFCTGGISHNPKCDHFADGGEIRDNKEFQNNPDLAVDNAILHHGLHHTITKTGITKSEDPGRVSSDFLDSARRGRKSVQSHSESMLDSKAPKLDPDAQRTNSLSTHLNALQENPELAMGIGGDLGDTFPVHHAALAAKTATAVNYLKSIKPQPTPGASLDMVLPPSKLAEKEYQRQLALAEDPKLIFQHAKDGTLVPQDFQTLAAIYPKLRNQIQDKAFETIATAKEKGRKLTYAQKRKLGALIGEPVTFQQSPQACQAIMKANAPPPAPQPPAGKPKKATGIELKQINKVQELSESPLQKLQTARNS